MTRFADLHSHTPYCGHAPESRAEEFAAAALKAGLAFYGVSDHFPLPGGYPCGEAIPRPDYPLYLQWVADVKKYLAGSGVEVLYASEIDFLGEEDPGIMALWQAEPFDYRIRSVHFEDHLSVDNLDNMQLWETRGNDAVWTRYAELVCRMVDRGGFEIIGHIDLPKKAKLYPSDRSAYLKAIRPALVLAAEKGIRMELNTSGLRKPVGEIYPSFEIVRAAFEAGVEITFGSDSHAPGEVAADFDKALELARAAGYKRAWAFRQKVPVELPFD